MTYAFLPPGRRPAIAAPLDSGLRTMFASIALFPAFSLKRKLFKLLALPWAFLLWGLRRIRVVRGAQLQDLDELIVRRIHAVCGDAVSVSPMWSQVPGRPRRYFRVFDRNAEQVGFAKVSTEGPAVNLLRTEARALQTYREASTFDCPDVIALEEINAAAMLVTSPLPKGSRLLHAERHAFPTAIQNEIAGKFTASSLADLRVVDWFRKGCTANEENTRFLALLDHLRDDTPVQLCAAHGDFGSENFFSGPSGRTFLIDWEHFCDRAPMLTDAMGFWIGKHHRGIQAGDPKIVDRLTADFPDAAERDLYLALLYLSAFNVRDAISLVKLWKS